LILDEEDQKKLIGDIIKSSVADPKEFPKKDIIAKIISEAANEGVSVAFVASRWLTKTAQIDPEAIDAIAKKYVARKQELGAMDFDDLLVNGLRLLKECDGVREMLQEHFLHVLVDEYQDTNTLQAEFTDILAAKHRNILAVGDDFQCIYTWRGARIENILDFPSRWSGCRIVKLEENYRSVPGILDIANVVMKDAPKQFEKHLKARRDAIGGKPCVHRVYDSREQASEIMRVVAEMRSSGYHLSDMAVLYRSHFQSIDIQMTLARAGVPFRITSGVGVFEQIHVKDILSYLRLILNPRDELSFMRFVRLFPGVGEKGAEKMWSKLGSMFDASRREDREALGSLFGAKAKPYWPAVSKCLEIANEHLDNDEVGDVIEDFVDLYYEDHLRREWDEKDAEDRLEDIAELAGQIAAAESTGGGRQKLEAFLQDVALLTNLDAKRNDTNTDKLTLSTIHQAKGMEWPVVFVPWLSEGLFPSAKAAEENRADEERRLFYVVVTRAKDFLHLYSPTIRKTSDGGMFPVEESIFLKEIPPQLVEKRRNLFNPAYQSTGGFSRTPPFRGGASSGWTRRW
jgi:DNA helicase-2/ATP-dependent DNA helicase PcrA